MGKRVSDDIGCQIDDQEPSKTSGGNAGRICVDQVLIDELRAHGSALPREQAMAVWGLDIELNAQGLEVWLDSQAN